MTATEVASGIFDAIRLGYISGLGFALLIILTQKGRG